MTSGFDFSQYDADHDGKIDAINCFYAGTTSSGMVTGPVAAFRQRLVHRPTASRPSGTRSATWGRAFASTPSATRTGTCSATGPTCTTTTWTREGVGRFCLMCDMASGHKPVQPCAYLKYIAGWAETSPARSLSRSVCRSPPDQNRIYKFDHPTKANEYFLIENRQKTGRDQAIPDAGLALWHIDTERQQRLPATEFPLALQGHTGPGRRPLGPRVQSQQRRFHRSLEEPRLYRVRRGNEPQHRLVGRHGLLAGHIPDQCIRPSDDLHFRFRQHRPEQDRHSAHDVSREAASPTIRSPITNNSRSCR